MVEFNEVAERVWVAHNSLFDVNVAAVAGERGLVIADTFTSAAGARLVRDALRRVCDAPILAVVNTHVHFDHTFGNLVFAEPGTEVIAQENAAAALPAHAAEVRDGARRESEPHWAEIAATEIRVPDRTFASVLALDLGDRYLEILHPGRGHTDGDAVVFVPDAEVVLAGDLVENATAGDPVPAFGEDCFPLEWPATLDVVMGLLTERSTVVPGHGPVVDQGFVGDQRATIGIVAETIRDLAMRGVTADQALTAGTWPFPVDRLGHAVARAYDQLPRNQRSLPLL